MVPADLKQPMALPPIMGIMVPHFNLVPDPGSNSDAVVIVCPLFLGSKQFKSVTVPVPVKIWDGFFFCLDFGGLVC